MPENSSDSIQQNPKEEYGEHFQEHCLEIYKVYIEMSDRISERRQTANSFFLSINTAIISLVGYLYTDSTEYLSFDFYLLISFSGMLICYIWHLLVVSYRKINSAKFKIIHQIEQKLPLSPYYSEWKLLEEGRNPKVYLAFTYVEMWVPWIFLGLHTIVFVKSLLNF